MTTLSSYLASQTQLAAGKCARRLSSALALLYCSTSPCAAPPLLSGPARHASDASRSFRLTFATGVVGAHSVDVLAARCTAPELPVAEAVVKIQASLGSLYPPALPSPPAPPAPPAPPLCMHDRGAARCRRHSAAFGRASS